MENYLPGGPVTLVGQKPPDEEERQKALVGYREAVRAEKKLEKPARYAMDPDYRLAMLQLTTQLAGAFVHPEKAAKKIMVVARPHQSIQPDKDRGAARAVARLAADRPFFGRLIKGGALPRPDAIKSLIDTLLAIEARVQRRG